MFVGSGVAIIWVVEENRRVQGLRDCAGGFPGLLLSHMVNLQRDIGWDERVPALKASNLAE